MGAAMKQVKKGFTLVELMVVISIIGILAAIVVPSITAAIEAYGLTSATHDFAFLLRKARSKAIKERRTVVIVFELTQRGGILDGQYVFDADGESRAIIPEKKYGSLSRRYSGVQFGFGNANKSAAAPGGDLPESPVTFQGRKVSFNSMGTSNAGYVYFSNKKGSASAVGLISTGIIRVKTWNGLAWK
jgi:prepilin-type N-terminal cleavage/methylation domain-containing protein